MRGETGNQNIEYRIQNTEYRSQEKSRTQGSSPGLRDNAPLALKESHDFRLGFSISSKARVSIAKSPPQADPPAHNHRAPPSTPLRSAQGRGFVSDPHKPRNGVYPELVEGLRVFS